jgi:hypothetical protein
MPVETIAKKQKVSKIEVAPFVPAAEHSPHAVSKTRVVGKTTLNPGEFRKAQRIVVSVVAVDADGASSEPVMLEIDPRNTPPSRPSVALEPMTPTIETGLKASVAVSADDRDQDRPTYHFRWYRNGVYAQDIGDRAQLQPGELKHGEEWRVVMTATDGEGESESAEMRAVVANTAPVAPVIAIAPVAPTAVTGLRCPITKPAADADGDPLVLEYRWWRNGQPFSTALSAAEIPGHVVRPGEVWQCDVVAFDGQLRSVVASAKATVENAAPPSPVLEVSPRAVKTGNPVKCLVSTDSIDPDGDRVSYEVRWEPPVGVTVPVRDEAGVLPAGFVKRGQVWQCVVTASDGRSKSAPVRAEVSIGNLAPIPPTLSIEPSAPVPATDLRCVFAKPATDPDGDRISYAFSWSRNGVVQPFAPSSTEVPGRLVKAGERWSCSVVASDGTDTAVPARSPEVTVGRAK